MCAHRQFGSTEGEQYKYIRSRVDKYSRVEMNFLIRFMDDGDWNDFRYAELNALLELNHIDPNLAYIKNENSKSVFQTITLPNVEVVCNICSRSVLIRAVYELWGGLHYSFISLKSYDCFSWNYT